MDNIQQNIPRANLKKKNIARLVLYSELSKYYTMEEIDQMLATISEGGFVDLRSYLKKSEVDSQLSATSELPVQNKVIYEQLQRCITERDLSETLENYQQKLVSGENIKTINNQSILGAGNINIQGGGGDSSLITVPIQLQNGYVIDAEGEFTNEELETLFGSATIFDPLQHRFEILLKKGINSLSNLLMLASFSINELPIGNMYSLYSKNGDEIVRMSWGVNNGVYVSGGWHYSNLGSVSTNDSQTLNDNQKETARENIGIDLEKLADLDNTGKLQKSQLPTGVVTEYANASDIESLFSQPEQQEISGEHAGEISNGEVIGDTPIRDN